MPPLPFVKETVVSVEPEFAVDRFTLQSNNPVFGLNTMGGAVTLDMKNGLTFDGAGAELSGGSFGNVTGNAEYGARFGHFGIYVGVGGLHDDGFRYHSPTSLEQVYGDLAYEAGNLTLHLSLSGADNRIAAVGPTPVEMLAVDRRAIFTYPQAMRNEMALAQLRGTYGLGWFQEDYRGKMLNFHTGSLDGAVAILR